MIQVNGFILSAILTFTGALSVSAQENPQAQPAEARSAVVIPPSTPPSPAAIMESEWKFIKTYAEDKNDEIVTAILPELEAWLKLYPESEFAPEAQLLKAKVHLRLGEHESAIVDLLKQLQEYPTASSNPSARKLFGETVKKELGEKNAAVLNETAKVSESSDKPERLAAAYTKLAERAGKDFYEPLVKEFREFFGRFAAYPGRDALQMALGDLHLKKEEYISARLAYEEVIHVYPGSKFLVKAKKALGDVMANNLKEYDNAILVYQDVAAGYPGTDEAWAAYGQLAKLSERQKKYALAVEIHEKIIALYPEKDAAYDSFAAEARILRDEMGKFPESVSVLGRLADKYKGEKAIEALYLAAKIAKKDMKDLGIEIKMYDRIAAEYFVDPQAPKALFAAAEAYENAKDFEKAREYYGKVSDKYPQDSLAAKSQKRINAIINK